MASSSTARFLTRAIQRTASTTTSLRPTSNQLACNAQKFRQSAHRQYSSQIPKPNPRTGTYFVAVATIAAVASGFYLLQSDEAIPKVHLKKGSANETVGIFKPTSDDYQKVYNAIAKLLWEKDDYDDGSYGPVLLRLAWHASGTYDAATGTGGSDGATMRFAPEKDHGANSGLENARQFIEPVKEQFPWISYADLWILGGVCAIQEMQGPVIPWRPGRHDRDESYCSPDGRLPDGAKGQDHLRAIFGRMGFNDQEIVALSGAHALGRCHSDRSGFEGPWTFSPTVLTNDFYRLLMEEKWGWRKWDGQKQYQDNTSKSLMMLPTDMALIHDKEFKKYVAKYAEDGQVFFKDFSDVIVKLFELGVPFKDGSERLHFATLDEQEA